MTARVREKWTDAEIRYVRDFYGVHTNAEIAKALGRTEQGVILKGRSLGLCFQHSTQGYESLKAAAARHNFDEETMLRILNWSSCQFRSIVQNQSASRGRRHKYYIRESIDAAVVAWLDSETPYEAARRVGFTDVTLRRWLRLAGESPPKRKKQWRISRATIDRIVAEHLAADTIASAARRLGVCPKWLSRAVVREGIPKKFYDVSSSRTCGGRSAVMPDVIDALVARHRGGQVAEMFEVREEAAE